VRGFPKRETIVFGCIVLLCVAVNLAFREPSRSDSPSQSRSAAPRRATSPGPVTLRECFAAATYDDLSECTRLCVNRDERGLQLMIAAGRLIVVPDGVKARIVDAGILAHEVRIEEGAYKDRRVWIAPEFAVAPP
jgi:hypothetical protein